MLAVLDAPVAPVCGQDVGGVGLPGGQASDPVNGLGVAGRVLSEVEGLPVDAERLVDVGEVDAGDIAGAPDGAQLDAAVAPVIGGVVRGENPRARRGREGTARPGPL
jgi:hypothetical protein